MEIRIGEVDDFFAKVGVAAFKVESDFSVGDTIHVKGHTTDVTQMVDSIQVDHKPVQSAKKGESVGIKAKDRIRKGDIVYKIAP
jgi:translation elongation factor EF-1alpha